MELLLKRVFVVITAISVAVPAIYLTMAFHTDSQYEKNPVNYIPSSVSLAAKLDSSYGLFYVFIDNYSVGIISSISVFTIPSILDILGNSTNTTSSLAANATLEYYEEYRGISIFQLEGVNASAVVQAFASQEPVVTGFLNYTENYANLSNITFYIASPQNSFSVIGGVSLIKASIDAYIGHSGLTSVKNVKFNPSCNLSLIYYPPPELGITHMSLNLSNNYTEIFMGFKSLNSTTLLSLSTLAVKYGFEVYLHENSIEMIVDRGI